MKIVNFILTFILYYFTFSLKINEHNKEGNFLHSSTKNETELIQNHNRTINPTKNQSIFQFSKTQDKKLIKNNQNKKYSQQNSKSSPTKSPQSPKSTSSNKNQTITSKNSTTNSTHLPIDLTTLNDALNDTLDNVNEIYEDFLNDTGMVDIFDDDDLRDPDTIIQDFPCQSNKDCYSKKGSCVNHTCHCSHGFTTFMYAKSPTNTTTIGCNYQRKDKVKAIFLAMFLGCGIEHYYLGNMKLFFYKAGYLAFMFLFSLFINKMCPRLNQRIEKWLSYILFYFLMIYVIWYVADIYLFFKDRYRDSNHVLLYNSLSSS